MKNLLWLLLLVAVVVIAFGIMRDAQRCEPFHDGTVCEKRSFIPGLLIGIPSEQVGFDTIVFLQLRATTKEDPLQVAVDLVTSRAPREKQENLIVEVRANAENASALLFCFSNALRNFSSEILTWAGIKRPPEKTKQVANLYCLIFTGGIQ